MDQSSNNKRIAKNTLMLYIRMLFTMGVSLFTSRVILQTLGVEDYGVYSVVGGIIAMFTFINGGNTIIAAVMAAIVFKEKLTVKSVLGIVLGIGALVIIKAF